MRKLIAAILLGLFVAAPVGATGPFQPIAPQQTAIGTNVIYTGKNLVNLSVVSSTNANQWIMIFDGTTLPGDGATAPCSTAHTTGCLAWCEYAAGSNATTTPWTYSKDFGVHPLAFQFGIVVTVSTTLCTTKTITGSTNFFYGQVY